MTTPILEHMTALADPVRCRVLLLLERHELTVSELCSVLQMPQSSVSRQLKTLADDGWVSSRRDGTSRFYGMGVDDLDPAARQLWPLIRDQVAGSTAAAQDERRLASVIKGRRATSQRFFATAASEWDQIRQELYGETFYLWGLLGLIDPGLVVGDLGCGSGQLAEALAPYVKKVVGVDASEDMLAAARARLEGTANVVLRRGELETLPVGDGELDAAMLSLVLHHSPDPARALREAHRVLRRRGRVLVVDMLPHEHEEYQQRMGHVWLGFSEKHMTRVLAGAGFEAVRVRMIPADRSVKGPALFAAAGVKT
jgi:ArsR family transcriptional regulator